MAVVGSCFELFFQHFLNAFEHVIPILSYVDSKKRK